MVSEYGTCSSVWSGPMSKASRSWAMRFWRAHSSSQGRRGGAGMGFESEARHFPGFLRRWHSQVSATLAPQGFRSLQSR